MDDTTKAAITQQFGAALDMLENALAACPDELWQARLWAEPRLPRAAEFWYLIFHTLFWADLYLSGSEAGFAPPAPFTLEELDPAGVIPERAYRKDELLLYLEHTRRKLEVTVGSLTGERALQPCTFSWGEVTFAALLLDTLRHVQEHAAQLNMFLGQQVGWSPRWVTRARKAAGGAA